MFFRTPFFLPWIYPNACWRLPTGQRDLYLTFDDGPVPGPTDFVLAELDKRRLLATFFCIGDNVRKYPDLFGKIVERGHSTGNHTFNHLKGWSTPVQEYVENVSRCEAEFSQQLTVPGPRAGDLLFRPPYGRITRAQAKRLAGYRIVMWDVLTLDYAQGVAPEKCLKGSIGAVRPGSIVVFHDSYKAERNLTYALPRFMDHCLDRGYLFKAITNSYLAEQCNRRNGS